jgi:hypothetical protein
MRDLTPLELEAVGGGRVAPAPTRPRIDLRRLVLTIISRIFGRPGLPPTKAV